MDAVRHTARFCLYEDYHPHKILIVGLFQELRLKNRASENKCVQSYLDFAKAFDSINHRPLLAKLETFGQCEKVVRWIRSYLTERTYRVQVAEALSQETRIKRHGRSHGQSLPIPHPLQRDCLQSMMNACYDKAVVL